MYLDQKVTVICTDNDTSSNGKIVRIFPNGDLNIRICYF